MKSLITDKVINILKDRDFSVCDCQSIQSCFDIFAKKEKVLLIKILMNIEGLTRASAMELKFASIALSGAPLLIGERMKNANLRDGVVYTRYGIHAFTCSTLRYILDEISPLIYSVRGDYVVNVGSELLKNLRTDAGMTMQELADELKISKQSIYRYEHSGVIPLNIVSELLVFFEDFNESDIKFKNNIFNEQKAGEKNREEIKSEIIAGHLTDLMKKVICEFNHIGFSTTSLNAPFDILAEEEEMVFTVVSNDLRTLKKKIKIVRKISDMTGSYKICVSEKKQDVDIFIIKPDELKEIGNSKELLKLLIDN